MIEPFSSDHQNLKTKVDEFFKSGKWSEDNPSNDYCRAMIRAMGDAGLLKYTAPSPSSRDLCFLRYCIAQHTAIGDLLFAMQGLGSYPVSIAGSELLKAKYLSGVAEGKLISAFAITEPEAGSDAGALSLRAEKSGSDYVLNGTKTFISNAGLADFYTIFARTSEGNKGVTAFVLDAATPGLQITALDLISVHPIGRLDLKDCRIPENHRLGIEGEGFKVAMMTLDVFRSSVAAAATGMAERALYEAITYAKKRRQFGKSLAEFQAVQFKIAEMAQLLRSSKLLVWDAAVRKDGGVRTTLESAIAKSFATESAQQIIDQALQLHGGAGLIKGSITERLYRDIRALRIYEGTTEVLKSIIAAQYLQ
jgi:acyl-CoA dehydrogenase